MAANFQNITLADMDSVLKPESGWTRSVEGAGREYVYSFSGIRSVPNLVIKVFSSVHCDTGRGRGRGHDAIRVAAVRYGRGYIRSGRVNRTQGWRGNLETRVMNVIREARERFERDSVETTRRAPALPSITEEQREAGRWLSGYTGDFTFLREMRSRLERLLALSERQWQGVIRSMARENRGAGRSRRSAPAREEQNAPFGRGGRLEEVVVEGNPWA